MITPTDTALAFLPKKATAHCAAALSVFFPEKSEQTSDKKPKLSERIDKVVPDLA